MFLTRLEIDFVQFLNGSQSIPEVSEEFSTQLLLFPFVSIVRWSGLDGRLLKSKRLCWVGGPHPSCGGADRKLSRTDCCTALSLYMLHMLHRFVCS